MPFETPVPLRVFIADDSVPVVEMLTQFLARPGAIEVVGVGATEREALDSIEGLKPDVMLVDLELGEGSGANVIRAVRARPEWRELNLFVTSSHDSQPLRAGVIALGADGYYDKVKELLALSEKLEELSARKAGGATAPRCRPARPPR